jgi:DNA-binding MarR family transcriptional regulator
MRALQEIRDRIREELARDKPIRKRPKTLYRQDGLLREPVQRVLEYLAKHPGRRTIEDIGEGAGVKQGVSGILNSLSDHGLVDHPERGSARLTEVGEAGFEADLKLRKKKGKGRRSQRK